MVRRGPLKKKVPCWIIKVHEFGQEGTGLGRCVQMLGGCVEMLGRCVEMLGRCVEMLGRVVEMLDRC